LGEVRTIVFDASAGYCGAGAAPPVPAFPASATAPLAWRP